MMIDAHLCLCIYPQSLMCGIFGSFYDVCAYDSILMIVILAWKLKGCMIMVYQSVVLGVLLVWCKSSFSNKATRERARVLLLFLYCKAGNVDNFVKSA